MPKVAHVRNASAARERYAHRQTEDEMLQMKAVHMEFPADANIIVGQSHFIKGVEDLYEAVATTAPQATFGLQGCPQFCLPRKPEQQ